MVSLLRIRERLSSFFWPNAEDLRVIEIPEAEAPPIPERLNSQQFPQKEFVAGVEALLPEILKESKKYEGMVQIFVALTLLESVEETKAKFFFPSEMREEAAEAILAWAQVYQEKSYLLPPLMVTIHWSVEPSCSPKP